MWFDATIMDALDEPFSFVSLADVCRPVIALMLLAGSERALFPYGGNARTAESGEPRAQRSNRCPSAEFEERLTVECLAKNQRGESNRKGGDTNGGYYLPNHRTLSVHHAMNGQKPNHAVPAQAETRARQPKQHQVRADQCHVSLRSLR